MGAPCVVVWVKVDDEGAYRRYVSRLATLARYVTTLDKLKATVDVYLSDMYDLAKEHNDARLSELVRELFRLNAKELGHIYVPCAVGKYRNAVVIDYWIIDATKVVAFDVDEDRLREAIAEYFATDAARAVTFSVDAEGARGAN